MARKQAKTAKWICPVCGWENRPEGQFCHKCGYNSGSDCPAYPTLDRWPGSAVPGQAPPVVVPPEMPEPPETPVIPESPEAPETWSCPVCGEENSLGDRFCSQCGFDTERKQEPKPPAPEPPKRPIPVLAAALAAIVLVAVALLIVSAFRQPEDGGAEDSTTAASDADPAADTEANATADTDTDTDAPQSLTLDQTSVTLHEGESAVLTAVTDVDGWEGTVTWETSDEEGTSFTVTPLTDATAEIAWTGEGQGTVIAVVGDGISAVCAVTCGAKTPSALSLNYQYVSLGEGGTAVLTATTDVDGWEGAVTWETSDEDGAVFTVTPLTDTTAEIAWTGEGQGTVTAVVGDGVSAVCTVSCAAKPDADNTLEDGGNTGSASTDVTGASSGANNTGNDAGTASSGGSPTTSTGSNILGDVGGTGSTSLDGTTAKSKITEVYFLDTLADAPSDARDLSADGSGGVLCWTEGSVQYIAGEGGVTAGTSCKELFRSYSSLTAIHFSGHFDTSNTRSMVRMFAYCEKLTSLDVSDWDTSSVTDMTAMFNACKKLTTLDLSDWDTSSVTNLYAAFFNCQSLTSLDVSGWDTSKVTDMEWTFSRCGSLTSLDLSGWDTSKVTVMHSMFKECTELVSLDLSGWDTSKVTNMESMFESCSALTDFDPGWLDTSNADTTDMYVGTLWE